MPRASAARQVTAADTSATPPVGVKWVASSCVQTAHTIGTARMTCEPRMMFR